MNYEQLLEKLKVDLPNRVQTVLMPDGFWFWAIIVICILVFIGFLFWIYPLYNVWASKKSGEADLEQAHFEQQVQVAEANGRLQAAETNKKAAIIEAEAVAKQIETIGTNLQKHDLYLKWQWIKMMEDHSDSATIYIPTEAGLPILEAGKNSHNFKNEE